MDFKSDPGGNTINAKYIIKATPENRDLTI